MIFSWFKDRRREQLLAEPFPAAWEEYLANNMRQYAYLEPPKRAVIQAVVRVVVAEKHWSGGAGFDLTDEMKVTVAGQASLLVLGLDEPYFFDRLQSIILYPTTYVRSPRLQRYLNEGGGRPLLGEAWYHSPIVLSWKHVLQVGRNESSGGNLVLHEFAHYLDGLDGSVDGAPPLPDGAQEETWYRVTDAEYRRLVGQARRHEVTLLNQYGATNRAEFFAVATECFFEQARAMQRQHEELYGVLRDFYRQDPGQCWPDATVTPSDKDQQPTQATDQADTVAFESKDADELFTFAVVCLNDGRHELAENVTSRAIELDPSDAELYQYRAVARIKLGKYAAALEDCDQALRLDDSDMDAYRTRGAAYVGLQQYELAKDDLDRVLQVNRTDAEAFCVRGSALVGLNQFQRGLADLSASIALNPLSAEAYYYRGLAFRKLGRAEDANADMEKALQLDPDVGQWR
jgi:hypothetical protein